MSHKLLDGAVIVSDAHFSSKNLQFLDFLKKVVKEEIKTDQLILLGDNFDLLIPPLKKTIENNQEAIDLINQISKEIEVIYFEGNHDFFLKKLFPKVKVFSFFQQPVTFFWEDKTTLFSHGDWGNNIEHSLLTTLFRHRFCVGLVNILSGNFLSYWLEKRVITKLKEKNICTKINNFEEIITKRYKKRKTKEDFIIEGHFHQGREFSLENAKYINVDSFACNQSYLVVECSHNMISFVKKTM